MRSLKQLLNEKRGQVESVRMVGVMAITIVIIVLVYFNIRNSSALNTTNDTASATGAAYNPPSGSVLTSQSQRSTMLNIDSQVSSGFEMYGLAVLVTASSIVLFIISRI